MKIHGLENLVAFCDSIDNYYLIESNKLTEYEIDQLLNLNNLKLNKTLASYSGLKEKHIDKLLSLNDPSINLTLSIYTEKFTNKQFDSLLNAGNNEIIIYLSFKKLNAKQLDMLLKLQLCNEILINLVRNKSVSLKMKQKIIDDTIKESIFK